MGEVSFCFFVCLCGEMEDVREGVGSGECVMQHSNEDNVHEMVIVLV